MKLIRFEWWQSSCMGVFDVDGKEVIIGLAELSDSFRDQPEDESRMRDIVMRSFTSSCEIRVAFFANSDTTAKSLSELLVKKLSPIVRGEVP